MDRGLVPKEPSLDPPEDMEGPFDQDVRQGVQGKLNKGDTAEGLSLLCFPPEEAGQNRGVIFLIFSPVGHVGEFVLFVCWWPG